MAGDESDGAVPDDKDAWPGFDVTVAHPARVYNYLLGGKDNFAADRKAAEQMIAGGAKVLVGVRANRRSSAGRSVSWRERPASASSWISGPACPQRTLPMRSPSLWAPRSRIVYVDNDPIVLSHASALLKSAPGGACHYIQADLRDPRKILDGNQSRVPG